MKATLDLTLEPTTRTLIKLLHATGEQVKGLEERVGWLEERVKSLGG
jgi:hypothetical protein